MLSPARTVAVPFALVALIEVACTTRPLSLAPQIRPSSIVVVDRFPPLHMVSFVDATAPESPTFAEGYKRKTFAQPPIKVVNDALLTSLRASQAFEFVDRDQPIGQGRWILEGKLVKFETEESTFKFASSSVRATCVIDFVLREAESGDVVVEASIGTDGFGGVEVSGGTDVYWDSQGQAHHTPYSSADSTGGYETSMSNALSEGVAGVTEAILLELIAQRAAEVR